MWLSASPHRLRRQLNSRASLSEVDRDLARRHLAAKRAHGHLGRATLADRHVAAWLEHDVLDRVEADAAQLVVLRLVELLLGLPMDRRGRKGGD